MPINLSILLFLPLAAGLLTIVAPARVARWIVLAGAALALAYTVAALAAFERTGGLQWVTDVAWIPELGVRYSLGIDGLNLFMVALTTLLWVPATLVAAMQPV